MSPHNDPEFAFGNFGKIIFNSTICSNRESRVGSQFFVCLFGHRSPSKLMNLKVIQFLLAGAHPLRANAVEHLGIAVSETLRDVQNCGHQKTSSQNILYSCSDRSFLILFQALVRFWHLPRTLAAKYIRYSPPVKVNEYSSYI